MLGSLLELIFVISVYPKPYAHIGGTSLNLFLLFHPCPLPPGLFFEAPGLVGNYHFPKMLYFSTSLMSHFLLLAWKTGLSEGEFQRKYLEVPPIRFHFFRF